MRYAICYSCSRVERTHGCPLHEAELNIGMASEMWTQCSEVSRALGKQGNTRMYGDVVIGKTITALFIPLFIRKASVFFCLLQDRLRRD